MGSYIGRTVRENRQCPQPRPTNTRSISLASSPFLEMNLSSLEHPLSAQPTPLLGPSPIPFETQDPSCYRKPFLLAALASPSYPQLKEGTLQQGLVGHLEPDKPRLRARVHSCFLGVWGGGFPEMLRRPGCQPAGRAPGTSCLASKSRGETCQQQQP